MSQPNGSPLIQITGLHSGYGGVPVVRDINLHVGAGEVVALLGPNGAGKTTTLLTVSGIVKVLDGAVAVCGSPVKFGSPYRMAKLGLGHVPEDRSLFFSLTVRENLKLGLRGSGVHQREGYDRALQLLPALRPLMDRRAGLLSGGEQQMLAIARALMARPKLLLLDEPSLGLAPLVVSRIFEVIRELNREGATILLVEQNAQMALKAAHRGYVLETGTIAMADAADKLLSDPRVRSAYLGDAS